MRIHPRQSDFTGNAWQVTGNSVRQVALRRAVSPTVCLVARFVWPDATHRTGAVAVRMVHASTSDLFLDEREARAEFRRRQDRVRCTNDRRVWRDRGEGLTVPAIAAVLLVVLVLFV